MTEEGLKETGVSGKASTHFNTLATLKEEQGGSRVMRSW